LGLVVNGHAETFESARYKIFQGMLKDRFATHFKHWFGAVVGQWSEADAASTDHEYRV
jgi:hypothetical protein